MIFSMIRLRHNISPHDIYDATRQNGYQDHQLVWNLFSDHPDRKRDFLYRYESVKGLPTFYAVSRREPQDISGMWEITSKAYSPKLRAGQRLGFTLSANPIRSKRDESGRQHRHDVIMEAKLELNSRGESTILPNVVQERGTRWLLDRATTHGFSVSPEGIRADGYRQHRLFKGKGKPPITFSTLDFNGILTVTDPETFVTECLFKGIGPAKGFGCGLMMVRRV